MRRVLGGNFGASRSRSSSPFWHRRWYHRRWYWRMYRFQLLSRRLALLLKVSSIAQSAALKKQVAVLQSKNVVVGATFRLRVLCRNAMGCAPHATSAALPRIPNELYRTARLNRRNNKEYRNSIQRKYCAKIWQRVDSKERKNRENPEIELARTLTQLMYLKEASDGRSRATMNPSEGRRADGRPPRRWVIDRACLF